MCLRVLSEVTDSFGPPVVALLASQRVALPDYCRGSIFFFYDNAETDEKIVENNCSGCGRRKLFCHAFVINVVNCYYFLLCFIILSELLLMI